MATERHLEELAISDTGFVFDPYTGATFTVNRTGLLVLGALKEGLHRGAVADRIRAQLLVQNEDLDADLDDFMNLLRQHGLIAPDFVLPLAEDAGAS